MHLYHYNTGIHTQQHTNGNKIMENLKIQNDNGSTYSFYVDDFKIYIDARTPKGVLHTFRVNGIEDGKISTSGFNLPVHKQMNDIVDFIKNAKTRTLAEFDTHEELMALIMSDAKTGQGFDRNGKHCVYVYNK